MPDISIKEEFLNDLSSVKNAGEGLSTQYAGDNSHHTDSISSGQDATETTKAFSERYIRFRNIITEYQGLLRENIGELEQFYRDINNLDKARS